MYTSTKKFVRVAVLALFAGLLFVPTEAEAQSRRHHHHRHHHGEVVRVLPRGHARVVVHGRPYFHHGGVFYRGRGADYVVVRAPVGAVVHRLPRGHRRVRRHGVVYYRHAGVYYRPVRRHGRRAYVVVRF